MFPAKEGRLTVEQLEQRVRPRLRCHLTGYRVDDRLDDLAIDPEAGVSSEWYVPIVSENDPLPRDLGTVPFLLRIHPSRWEEFRSGRIPVTARMPESDVPLLSGSGDSSLFARNLAGLDPQRIWILEVVGSEAMVASSFDHLVPFLIVLSALFFAGVLLRPKLSRGVFVWPATAGVACAGTGFALLMLEPRLSPMLNELRPGTGVFLCGCAIVLIVRSIGGYFFAKFLKAHLAEAAVEKLLAGSDDALIVLLPDGVKLRQPDGSSLEVMDQQVEGVLLRHQFITNGDTGLMESFISRLILEFDLGEGVQSQTVQHLFSIEQTDPLVALSERLEVDLSERWIERLDRAGQIEVQSGKVS